MGVCSLLGRGVSQAYSLGKAGADGEYNQIPKANIPVIVLWSGWDHQVTCAHLSLHPTLPPLALLSLCWVSTPNLFALHEGISFFNSLNVVIFLKKALTFREAFRPALKISYSNIGKRDSKKSPYKFTVFASC